MTQDSPHQPFIGPARLLLKSLRLGWLLLISVVLIPLVPLVGKKRAPDLVGWWHGRLMRVFNVNVRIHGEMPRTPALIVTNHSTWLDIVVLGHVFDAAFISKAEVDKWPVIGVYARAIGTLFLSRGAYKTDETAEQIRGTFANGRSVVLFPEGTTCASLTPRRFHARLFSAALDGDHPVLPIGLRYSDAETPANRHHPLIPWVETPLGANVGPVFRLPRIQVDITICPMIDSTGHSRRSLAQSSHEAISQCLIPSPTEGTQTGEQIETAAPADAPVEQQEDMRQQH